MELGGATSGSCDLVPLNSTSRHTARDARTMKNAQSCVSTGRAELSSIRNPVESMKLTADRSSSAVTPSARAASSAELRRSAVLRSSSPLARMRQVFSSVSSVTLKSGTGLSEISSS